jgi:transposase
VRGRKTDLTDAQWALLEPLFPPLPRRADGKGRPWRPTREVLNGVLYVLRNGCRWCDLPERYPPYQTCHRRFQQWVRAGVLPRVLEALAEHSCWQLAECFVDATFAPAKKGVLASARHGKARAPRSWPSLTGAVRRMR